MRILLIEDEPEMASVLKTALERQDFVVDHVSTLADAEAMARLGTFDAVVLDRRLPDGDGVEAIERLRAVAPRVRVVIFTGAADRSTADRVAAAGGAGVLLKAGALEDMLDTIRTVAAGRQSFDVRSSGRR